MDRINCRGCGVQITEQNNSEAHIIPNALGGRLAPKKIICRNCNTALDSMADNALVEAFGDWPTLLNIPRQRGKNPPKIVQTQEEYKVRLNADGSLVRTDIQYDVNHIPEGHEVQIGAGDIKIFRQLLNRAAKQFPEIDPAEAEKAANVIDVTGDDKLKMKLDFSPQATFGGIVTAIWLYLIKETGRAFMNWDHLQSCIVDMQSHGGTFRYLTEVVPT